MNKRELAAWVVERHNVRHPNCGCNDAWDATSGGSPSAVILDDVIQQNDSDSGELIETLRHLLQQWEQRVVCPQCGQRYSDRACGPTHAVVMNLVRPNNADSGQALMSDLLQSELKPDLRKQVIHDDSHEGKV